jgi:cytochrome c553
MTAVRGSARKSAIVCALLAWAHGQAAERSVAANYALRCSGCHGIDGSGNPAAGIPDFRGYIGAFAEDDEGRTYVLHVPGVAMSSLSDREISAVVNYLIGTWAGASLRAELIPFTPEEVGVRRAQPITDVVAFRRRIVARLGRAGIRTADYPWP